MSNFHSDVGDSLPRGDDSNTIYHLSDDFEFIDALAEATFGDTIVDETLDYKLYWGSLHDCIDPGLLTRPLVKKDMEQLSMQAPATKNIKLRKGAKNPLVTWHPSLLGLPAQKEVLRQYPTPASGIYPSPMSASSISPPPAGTPKSTMKTHPTPTSFLDETRTPTNYSSSTSNMELSTEGSSSRSNHTPDSGYASYTATSTPREASSMRSMSSTFTSDSGYAFFGTPRDVSSPVPGSGQTSFSISRATDLLVDSGDETASSDDESMLSNATPNRKTGRKRKRTRLYIHVEDLMLYVRKKRRMDARGEIPQAPQRFELPNPPEQMPSRPIAVDFSLTTGSAGVERGTQIFDPCPENRCETSDSKLATDQSSDNTNSNTDGGDDSSSDEEEDDDLLDEMDLPEHKLDLFHMLGLDTSGFVQNTTGSRSGSGSGSGSGNSTLGSSRATPSSVTTGSFGSMTPSSQTGAAEKETKSPGDGIVTIDSRTALPKLVFGPLELKCWHAANGVCCQGKTGTSPDVRRLLDNHSIKTSSKKGNNHHKLPPKCQRCDRLFENEVSAEQHKEQLKSNSPCTILSPEELEIFNVDLNFKGISLERKNEIDIALRAFKKDKTLPPDYDRIEFNTWIARNRPIHIGRSDRSELKAELELGNWFVVWYTLFPGKEIPYHPFNDEGLDPKKCERILDLSMSGIIEDSAKGRLPELNQEHLDRIRQHFRNGMEIQCLELLQDRNATQKAKKVRRGMGISTSNPSSSPSSMVTPAPKQPKFFHPDHPSSATFKSPIPGSMGPPPSPGPDSRTPAAAMTIMPFPPPADSNGPRTSETEAPSHASGLQSSNSSVQNGNITDGFQVDEISTDPEANVDPSVFLDDSYSFQDNLSTVDGFGFQQNDSWEYKLSRYGDTSEFGPVR